MARSFNGTTDELNGAAITLLSAATRFTIMVRYKATTVSKGSAVWLVYHGSGSNSWGIRHNGSNLDLVTSGIAAVSTRAVPDATDWHTYIWRFQQGSTASGGEYAGWRDGLAKTIFNAAPAGLMATVSPAELDIGHAAGATHCPGGICDVAAWNVKVADSIIAELLRGVSPRYFPQARVAHFPINGHNAPERDTTHGYSLAVTGTTTVDPPRRVPYRYRSRVEPVWLVDIHHGETVIRGATRDLYEDDDYDALGEVYPCRVARDFTLLESMPDAGGVVEYGQAVLHMTTADGGLLHSEDYQGDGIRVRKYDRIGHSLSVEFVGRIDHQVETAVNDLRFDCRSDDPSLRVLLPKATTDVTDDELTGFLNAADAGEIPTDTGLPIPVPCGDGGLCAPPFLRTVNEAPGGQEFLIAWGIETHVKRAWADTDRDRPGLDTQLLWEPAPQGNPTYASASTFTVTNDSDMLEWYQIGMEVRQSTDSGATWVVTHITARSLPTITVADAVLTTPLSNGTTRLFQLTGELILQRDKWEHVSGAGTTPLTTILDPGDPLARLMVELSTAARTHPADLLKFLIEDPDTGAGGTLNADDYAALTSVLTAAGLATAIRTVLGGDRRQRELRQWLNELAMLRGMRLWRSNINEWRVTVDSAVAAPTLTVGYGPENDDRPNNLLAPPSYDYLPLSDSVGVLKLQYAPGGRARSGRLVEQDYAWRTQMTVHPGGAERRMATTLIRDHDSAARVTYYIGKRLEHARRRGLLTVDHDGWDVRVGELVTDANQAADVRVVRKQQTLTTYSLTVAGHNADIYETNLTTIRDDVAQPTGSFNPDERIRTPGLPGNYIVNPDFSTGIVSAKASPTAHMLPGWVLINPSNFTNMIVVPDADVIGGFYLQFTTPGSLVGTPVMASPGGPDNYLVTSGYPVNENVAMLPSLYIDTTAAAGPATGLRLRVVWFNATSIVHSPGTVVDLRTYPGDTNRKTPSWPRIWGRAIPPSANAKNCQLWLEPTQPSTTYRISAVMLEPQLALTNRPSPWRPSIRTGIQPTQVTPGNQNVRVAGATTHGMVFSSFASSNYSTGGVTLSGASTTIATHAGGIFNAISGRVTTAITMSAGTTWQIREGSTTGRILVANIPAALNSTFDDALHVIASPVRIPALMPLIARPTTDGATFTGGKVKAAIHASRAQPPEA